jgi:hypothetical protein
MFDDHVEMIANEAGYQGTKYFPDDIWAQAVDTFPWGDCG